MDYITILPYEVLLMILSELGVCDFVHAVGTCKYLKTILDDESFRLQDIKMIKELQNNKNKNIQLNIAAGTKIIFLLCMIT